MNELQRRLKGSFIFSYVYNNFKAQRKHLRASSKPPGVLQINIKIHQACYPGMKNILLTTSLSLFIFSACKNNNPGAYTGWEVYGGTKEGIRFSSLTEIDTSNVHLLTP